MPLHKWIGLAGIGAHENRWARCWGKCSAFLNAIIAFLILHYWAVHIRVSEMLASELTFNLILWAWLTIDFLIGACLVNKKLFYVQRNWLKLIIFFIGIPPLLGWHDLLLFYRFLHPLLALCMLTIWSDYIWNSLSDNRLVTTLFIFLLVAVSSAFLITGIDPAIHSPWQGFWWVLVTMSTVGYGDVVPTSFVGQVLACVFILLGLGFFSIVTANVAALFVGQNVQAIKQERRKLLELVESLPLERGGLYKTEQSLEALDKRLSAIEKQMAQKAERTQGEE